MNTVMAGFDATVRQMTEMSQWWKCLSKKMTEITQRIQKQWKCHK